MTPIPSVGTDELLPCPFCGGKADPEGWSSIDRKGPACENAECNGSADSVAAWNRRAPVEGKEQCPRCKDWQKLGLSSRCPNCDRAAWNARSPSNPVSPAGWKVEELKWRKSNVAEVWLATTPWGEYAVRRGSQGKWDGYHHGCQITGSYKVREDCIAACCRDHAQRITSALSPLPSAGGGEGLITFLQQLVQVLNEVEAAYPAGFVKDHNSLNITAGFVRKIRAALSAALPVSQEERQESASFEWPHETAEDLVLGLRLLAKHWFDREPSKDMPQPRIHARWVEYVAVRVAEIEAQRVSAQAKCDALMAALTGMVDMYCALINSGDAGNWDPETDEPVIRARAALTMDARVAL